MLKKFTLISGDEVRLCFSLVQHVMLGDGQRQDRNQARLEPCLTTPPLAGTAAPAAGSTPNGGQGAVMGWTNSCCHRSGGKQLWAEIAQGMGRGGAWVGTTVAHQLANSCGHGSPKG